MVDPLTLGVGVLAALFLVCAVANLAVLYGSEDTADIAMMVVRFAINLTLYGAFALTLVYFGTRMLGEMKWNG